MQTFQHVLLCLLAKLLMRYIVTLKLKFENHFDYISFCFSTWSNEFFSNFECVNRLKSVSIEKWTREKNYTKCTSSFEIYRYYHKDTEPLYHSFMYSLGSLITYYQRVRYLLRILQNPVNSTYNTTYYGDLGSPRYGWVCTTQEWGGFKPRSHNSVQKISKRSRYPPTAIFKCVPIWCFVAAVLAKKPFRKNQQNWISQKQFEISPILLRNRSLKVDRERDRERKKLCVCL